MGWLYGKNIKVAALKKNGFQQFPGTPDRQSSYFVLFGTRKLFIMPQEIYLSLIIKNGTIHSSARKYAFNATSSQE